MEELEQQAQQMQQQELHLVVEAGAANQEIAAPAPTASAVRRRGKISGRAIRCSL